MITASPTSAWIASVIARKSETSCDGAPVDRARVQVHHHAALVHHPPRLGRVLGGRVRDRRALLARRERARHGAGEDDGIVGQGGAKLSQRAVARALGGVHRRGRRARAGPPRCRRRPGTSPRPSPRRASPRPHRTRSARVSASAMRSIESCTAPERPPRSVSTTTNSSPPSRATRSRSRTERLSRRATSRSASSPAACPCVSLTALKPSRSSISSPTERDRAPARDSAASSVRSSARRFARPGQRVGVGLVARAPVLLDARGHVVIGRDRAVELAVVVVQRVGVHLDPQQRPVAADEAHDEPGDLLAPQRPQQRQPLGRQQVPAVVEQVDRDAAQRAVHQLVQRHAEELRRGLVGHDHARVACRPRPRPPAAPRGSPG